MTKVDIYIDHRDIGYREDILKEKRKPKHLRDKNKIALLRKKLAEWKYENLG